MNTAGRSGWLDGLLQTLARKRPRPYRRRRIRLELERLEDRLAPATTITVIHATAGSGSLDSTLVANHGTISITDGNGGGMNAETLSDSELSSVSMTNNLDITARTSIMFNDLMGTLTLGGGIAPHYSFTADAGGISFANPTTNTLSDVALGGYVSFDALGGNLSLDNLVTNGGSVALLAIGGSITEQSITTTGSTDGNITLQADSMTFNGALNAGAGAAGGIVGLAPVTNSRPINLGPTVVPNQLNLTAADLNQASGSTLQIGANFDTGDITVSGAISLANVQALQLTTLGGIKESGGGSLTVPSLAVDGGAAGVNLTNGGNAVSVLAGSTTGAGAAFSFTDGSALIVGQMGLTVGVQTSNGAVSVTTNGALTVSQPIDTGSSANITLSADQMSLGAAVNAHAGIVTLEPNTSGRSIALGANVAGQLSLMAADLNQITTGILRIGSLTSGSLHVESTISAPGTWDHLSLISGGSIDEPGGSLSVLDLAVEAVGSVALTSTNNVVSVLAGNAEFNSFSFTDEAETTLAIATVDGVVGVSTLHNQGISLQADDFDLTQQVNAGALGLVSFQPTTNFDFTLGSGSAVGDSVGLTDAELAQVTAGVLGISTIGGNIVINGTGVSRHPGFNTLALQTGIGVGGSITQTQPLAVANLYVKVNGSVILTDPGNDVDVLDGDAEGVGGFSFTDAHALTISPVFEGLAGVTAPAGDVTLTTLSGALMFDSLGAGNGNALAAGNLTLNAAGPVTQDATSILAGASMLLLGAGPFILTNPANSVNLLAANVSGPIDFVDSVGLTIGANDGFSGVTSGDNTISIITGGPLVVSSTVNAAAAAVDLTVAASALALTNQSAIFGGSVTLTADAMSLSAGAINAGAGPVALLPRTPSLGINLGGDSGSGNLTLTANDLLTITAGVLSIGGAGFTGDLTINGLITDSGAGWHTLALFTGADVNTVAGAGFLQATNLAVQAGEGIGEDGSLTIRVSNLAFDNASGAVNIQNSGGLTLANVDGLSASSNGGATTLSAASPITFAADLVSLGTLIVVTGETTTETSSPLGSPDDDVTVLSGVTVESTGGDIFFQSADSVVLQAGSLVKADAGAVNIAVAFQDADADGVFSLQGAIVAANGVHLSPVPNNLELSLGGLATPGALPITLNGAFADAAAAEPHTVAIDWGDHTPATILPLAAGVTTFSASHVYAVEGNFAASVVVADAAGAATSGDIVVPVLPAHFGPIAAVDAQPGQTVSVSVVDPITGSVTTVKLVRGPGSAGAGGEFLAAKLLDAFFPPSPNKVVILGAYDFREFNLNSGDVAFVTVAFPAVVPPGAIPIVEYLDPDTGQLELFNPANPPGYLEIIVGPNTVTVTLRLDDTTIPKLTQLTGTEFTVSAAVPSAVTTAGVSQALASIDAGAAAPTRSAAFQSTSQVTFGLAASQSSQVSSELLSLDASSSGGAAPPPDDPAAAAAARAAWAQFVADEFGDDPEAVWQYGGDAAVRLWMLKHTAGPSAEPPTAPAPGPPREQAPPDEDVRLQALEFLFREPLEIGDAPAATGRPVAADLPAPPANPLKDGRRNRGARGAVTPPAVYLWAALGGLMLGNPERQRCMRRRGGAPERRRR